KTNSIGRTVEITKCQETIILEKTQEIQVGAPRIFSVKFQLGNGTKIPSLESDKFVGTQPISVHAIIDSSSRLDTAELRFVNMGESIAKYGTVKMDIIPHKFSK